jgi:hypothetical protein
MTLTELRPGQGAPNHIETGTIVTPEAVEVRVTEILDAAGYSNGRRNKVLTLTNEDGSVKTLKTLAVPHLAAYDDRLNPSIAFGVRTNNVLIARHIVPMYGVYSGRREIGMISELLGEYQDRKISISALRFRDGTHSVVFPKKFKGETVTEAQKVEMARALGVKV